MSNPEYIDNNEVCTIYKNEAKKDYEKKVFDMSSGQLSKVIKDGNDYYLIYCVDNYMKEESKKHKEKLIEEKKREYFNTKYKEFMDDASTDFNSSSIEDEKLPTTNEYSHYNLDSIYESEVK